jgi:hypothetical protein
VERQYAKINAVFCRKPQLVDRKTKNNLKILCSEYRRIITDNFYKIPSKSNIPNKLFKKNNDL